MRLSASRLAFAAGLSLFAALSVGAAEEAEGSAKLPADAPAEYRTNYLVAAGSVSPDGKLAVIYPTLDYTDKHPAKDFVVALRPFRVLTEIKTRWPYFQNQSNGGISVEWVADGSAALVTLESKWGPGDIFLYEFRAGELTRSTELSAKMSALLRPDFQGAKAERYNENFDFVFEADDEGADGGTVAKFDQAGGVEVRCVGNTNPKGIPGLRAWKARLVGVWNIAQARFTQQKVTRISAGKSRGE